jgi:hypothetical protein
LTPVPAAFTVGSWFVSVLWIVVSAVSYQDRLFDQARWAAFSWSRAGGATATTMRTADHRLTRWRDPQRKVVFTELYDCAADPSETRNVARDPGHERVPTELAFRMNEGWQGARADLRSRHG